MTIAVKRFSRKNCTIKASGVLDIARVLLLIYTKIQAEKYKDLGEKECLLIVNLCCSRHTVSGALTFAER